MRKKLNEEESKLDVKTKTIVESIVKIFELLLESLIHCNFFKKIATQICRKIN